MTFWIVTVSIQQTGNGFASKGLHSNMYQKIKDVHSSAQLDWKKGIEEQRKWSSHWLCFATFHQLSRLDHPMILCYCASS
jgi:phosphoribosylaminoimidazole (AIR) synthetase